MATDNWVNREIKKGLKIAVMPTEDPSHLDQPVWAINWFDLNRKWLYNLYIMMAARLVKRVGGRLLYKGHLIETISGDPKLVRHMLLIVSYPDINHFLDLIMIRSFQLISILRLGAVKDFIFGFTRKIAGIKISKAHYTFNKTDVYLIHHFIEGAGSDINAIQVMVDLHNVELIFSGAKTGIVYKQTADKNTATPFFMDGINLIKASERADLNDFLEDPGFKELLSQNSSNYLGIFQRDK